MNRRELGVGVASATLALGASQQAFAQSANGAVSTETLQAQIGRLPQNIQADVRKVYEQTNGRPVWNEARIRTLQQVAAGADKHALHSGDYFDFVGLAAQKDSADVRATASALSYAKVLAHGRIAPESVEDLWEMEKNSADVASGLVQAINGNRLAEWFDGLAPQDIGYKNLSTGYLRYRRIAGEGGWPAFRTGAQIEPGTSDPRVPALVRRLVAEGDLSAAAAASIGQSTVYSSAVQEGVRSFQTRHGLGVDGRVGPATQRSLSATAEDRARQIALNLERRRWLKRELQPERIEVNTAAAIMVYWKDNRPVHSNRVVVGSVENQTPSLERQFASVVANPPWTVPMGIARREILPRGPGYLAANDMYINDQGWVVQRAGPRSSLGYVKFELRDSYAIFLHDTPNKGAFNLSMRQRSHGCVRVHNAVEFARLLLSPDPAKLAIFDNAQADRTTTRVQTGRPIGVRLLYWTAFVDGQGRVAFREDSYRRDAKLARAMGIDVSLPEVVTEAPKDKDDDWL